MLDTDVKENDLNTLMIHFIYLLLSRWEDLTEECRLMHLEDPIAKIRLAAEISMEIGAVLYIAAALREARFLGLNMFIENLVIDCYYTE